MTLSPTVAAAPPRLKAPLHVRPYVGDSSQGRFLLEVGETCFVASRQTRDLLLALEENPADLDDLCRRYQHRSGLAVPAGELRVILEDHLPPSLFDGEEDAARRRPFIFSFQLLSPEAVTRVTPWLTWLFRPALVIPVLLLFAVVEALALPPSFGAMSAGLGAGELVVLYVALLTLGFFHEFGHAGACALHDTPHGGIGFGQYLFFPAFYADVTKAWRLSRWQRVTVDAGGLYFNCIFLIPVGLLALHLDSGLLLQVFWLGNFMMLFTLNPIFKMDGYWLLSDAAGVPNLQRRMGETVAGVIRKLRGRTSQESRLPALDRKRRRLLYVYSALAMSFYLYLLIFGIGGISRLLATYPQQAAGFLRSAFGHLTAGAFAEAALEVGRLLNRTLWPVLFAYVLYRIFGRFFLTLGRRLRSAVVCLVHGLCKCEPAAAGGTGETSDEAVE